MRKLLLLVVLLAVVVWLFTQKYTVKSGRDASGQYSVVMVNNQTGDIKKLIGD